MQEGVTHEGSSDIAESCILLVGTIFNSTCIVKALSDQHCPFQSSMVAFVSNFFLSSKTANTGASHSHQTAFVASSLFFFVI